MRRVACVLVALVAGPATLACAGSRRTDGPAPPPAPATEHLAEAERRATGPQSTPGPAEEVPLDPAKADPLDGVTGSAKVTFDGEERLLLWASGDEVAVGAHELACLADAGALSEPQHADARLENVAEDQGVTLGRLRVVRIERPLGGEAHRPRLCRPVQDDAALYAPLFRVREPASTWRLHDAKAGADQTLATLVDETLNAGKQPASVPRAVIVRGAVVAVALPVK